MVKIKGRYFNFTYLILPFVLMYLEFMLRIFAHVPTSFRSFMSIIFVSLAVGFLLDIFCSLFKKRKINAWIAIVIVELFTILFLLVYFVHDAFAVFFSLSTILKGAGGVAKDFGGNVFLIVLHGIPQIIVFELPFIAMLILQLKTKRLAYKRSNIFNVIAFLVAFIIFGGLGQFTMAVGASSKAKLTSKYDFGVCVESFNVLTAVQKDIRYGIFGNPYKGNFIVDDDDEEETTEPVEG